MFDNINLNEFILLVNSILNDENPPEKKLFEKILNIVINILDNEDITIRPKDNKNISGGLLDFSKINNNFLILPDLHARRKFLLNLINAKIIDNENIINNLEKNNVIIICLGDGIHSEAQKIDRWLKIYQEFITGFQQNENINKEFSDSFNLMVTIMLFKIRYPNNFHFLKGNHENILNEDGSGNYSFSKFVNEGAIFLNYFKKFYGERLLYLYSNFEKKLPLFVLTQKFLASHSEPQFFFTKEQIISYHENPELIESLTWTDNNSSEENSVQKIIDYYFNENKNKIYYFAGHRPISNLFNIINNNFVQIHNPKKQIIVYVKKNKDINLLEDIIDLEEGNI